MSFSSSPSIPLTSPSSSSSSSFSSSVRDRERSKDKDKVKDKENEGPSTNFSRIQSVSSSLAHAISHSHKAFSPPSVTYHVPVIVLVVSMLIETLSYMIAVLRLLSHTNNFPNIDETSTDANELYTALWATMLFNVIRGCWFLFFVILHTRSFMGTLSFIFIHDMLALRAMLLPIAYLSLVLYSHTNLSGPCFLCEFFAENMFVAYIRVFRPAMGESMTPALLTIYRLHRVVAVVVTLSLGTSYQIIAPSTTPGVYLTYLGQQVSFFHNIAVLTFSWKPHTPSTTAVTTVASPKNEPSSSSSSSSSAQSPSASFSSPSSPSSPSSSSSPSTASSSPAKPVTAPAPPVRTILFNRPLLFVMLCYEILSSLWSGIRLLTNEDEPNKNNDSDGHTLYYDCTIPFDILRIIVLVYLVGKEVGWRVYFEACICLDATMSFSLLFVVSYTGLSITFADVVGTALVTIDVIVQFILTIVYVGYLRLMITQYRWGLYSSWQFILYKYSRLLAPLIFTLPVDVLLFAGQKSRYAPLFFFCSYGIGFTLNIFGRVAALNHHQMRKEEEMRAEMEEEQEEEKRIERERTENKFVLLDSEVLPPHTTHAHLHKNRPHPKRIVMPLLVFSSIIIALMCASVQPFFRLASLSPYPPDIPVPQLSSTMSLISNGCVLGSTPHPCVKGSVYDSVDGTNASVFEIITVRVDYNDSASATASDSLWQAATVYMNCQPCNTIDGSLALTGGLYAWCTLPVTELTIGDDPGQPWPGQATIIVTNGGVAAQPVLYFGPPTPTTAPTPKPSTAPGATPNATTNATVAPSHPKPTLPASIPGQVISDCPPLKYWPPTPLDVFGFEWGSVVFFWSLSSILVLTIAWIESGSWNQVARHIFVLDRIAGAYLTVALAGVFLYVQTFQDPLLVTLSYLTDIYHALIIAGFFRCIHARLYWSSVSISLIRIERFFAPVAFFVSSVAYLYNEPESTKKKLYILYLSAMIGWYSAIYSLTITLKSTPIQARLAAVAAVAAEKSAQEKADAVNGDKKALDVVVEEATPNGASSSTSSKSSVAPRERGVTFRLETDDNDVDNNHNHNNHQTQMSDSEHDDPHSCAYSQISLHYDPDQPHHGHSHFRYHTTITGTSTSTSTGTSTSTSTSNGSSSRDVITRSIAIQTEADANENDDERVRLMSPSNAAAVSGDDHGNNDDDDDDDDDDGTLTFDLARARARARVRARSALNLNKAGQARVRGPVSNSTSGSGSVSGSGSGFDDSIVSRHILEYQRLEAERHRAHKQAMKSIAHAELGWD